MAEFRLPPGHPFTNVRPGYIGFQTAATGSIINAVASYVGAVGDYTNNTITLDLFATSGGTWSIATPPGLTVVTPAANGQAYTSAVYTGGVKGQTYTFTSIAITPPQGGILTWTGLPPSVTLLVPIQTTSIVSAYYLGGNAIYLTPALVSSLFPLNLGITGYFFSCTTSAAYLSVDSLTTGAILFPPGASFTPGTNTSLDFTVACRSNGILGGSSTAFTVGIKQPTAPLLSAALLAPNINLTWTQVTPGCTFTLSTGGTLIPGVTSPFSFVTSSPGTYIFAVQASLCGLGTFSLPTTVTIAPAEPSGISFTVTGLTVSLAWTGLGTGYTYNVSGTGLDPQTVTAPTATFTGVGVGTPRFFVQSEFGGAKSTLANVQVNVNTTPPYNFRSTTTGSTITLTWSGDTPGASYKITGAPLETQTGITDKTFAYTSVPGGTYSFVIVAISSGIESTSVTTSGSISLTAPTNFTVTTLSSTATLNWQQATIGASFNISYAVASIPKSKAVASGLVSTTISSLPAGSYTFGIQSIITGASSSFQTVDATVIADPTNFTSRSTGSTLSLSWLESTTGCTFLVSNATLGTKTTGVGVSNAQYTNVSPGSYIVSLTPSNTSAFVGATVTTTATVLATPAPSAVLSGTNVNVSWPAITGCTYTVSSSPAVTVPPADPGSGLTVTYVNPAPASYRFFVTAADANGNVSLSGSTGSVSVPVPTPSNIAAIMTSSSALTVSWNEGLPGCTFAITGGPAAITPVISGTNPYTGVFSGVPANTSYTMTVKASANGLTSAASQSATAHTFATFTASLTAVCTFTGGKTFVANVSYNLFGSSGQMVNPLGIELVGLSRTATRVFSGTTNPPVIDTASGLSGTFFIRFNTTSNIISNLIPQTFTQYVVPPSTVTTTASGTTLTVKWTDSTTTGCTYTVSGSAGGFVSNNLAAGSGTTGVQFTGAIIGTGYTFVVTASTAGTTNLSQSFVVTSVVTPVTTQTIGVPYRIIAVSPASTSVAPIAAPTGFTAFATGATIAIAWNAVTGATGYNVFNAAANLFQTTATSCNYAGTVGTTYTLTVQALSNSSASNTTTSITVIPVAPPTITSIRQTSGQITLTSPAPTGGITLSANTPGTLGAPTGTSTFTYTGAVANTAYAFTLSANGTKSVAVTNSNFTTLATPVIGSTFATGTTTITTNWTYTGTVTPTSFDIFSNNVVVSNVGSAIRTCTFNQTNGITSYAVFIVAKDSATSSESIPSLTCNVTGLTALPTSVVASANALSFTVQWVYLTTAQALSSFQVWNSTQTTTFGPAVDYTPASQDYNRLFDVPSAGSYSFVVVGKDSVGNTVVSAATTSVTTVAQPTVTSILQTMSSILVSCGTPVGGVTLSIPTTPLGLTAVTSTATTFNFRGAVGNTLYTFGVRATGTSASNSSNASFTTLATPGIPTVSASGTTVSVMFPAYTPVPAFRVWNDTQTVSFVTSVVGDTSASFVGTVGTPLILTVTASSAGSMSIASAPSASVTPIAPPTITSVIQNQTTITVSCGLPASGTTLSIPITPTGLTAGPTTATTFVYTAYTPGNSYSFTVKGTNGAATTSSTPGNVTTLFTPGTPTASSAGTTITVTWTYAGNRAGVTFNVVNLNNAGALLTSVVGALTAPFTGTAGVTYSVAVFSTSSGNTSPTSSGTPIQLLTEPTFTQDYQKTTQTIIVGTAVAPGASAFSGTQGSANLLSIPTAVGGVLTWTGATAGVSYSGISIGATSGGTTTTLANQNIQSAFGPTSIPGCVLWLDGADPNNTGTAPASGPISQWIDRSGNGNNSTSCVGTYDATTRRITNPIITGPVPSPATAALSIFVVGTIAALGATNDNLLALNVSPIANYFINTGFIIFRKGGSAAPGIAVFKAGIFDTASNQDTVNTPFIFDTMNRVVGNQGLFDTYLDGVPTFASPYALAGTYQYTHYYIGQCTGGPAWNGTIGEIIIYNSSLTTVQRQAVEGYLSWKWGKQGSLSSTNPYSPLAIPPSVAPPLALTLPAVPSSVTFLVVGGGGGGGSRFGGGGGAGGFLSNTLAVSASTPFTVTVGAGGAGGIGGTLGPGIGGQGNSSVFSTITAAGGGGGAAGDTGNGLAGASGGGGAGRANGDSAAQPYKTLKTTGGTGTSGQGNSGSGSITTSFVGGGGGGAGAAAVLSLSGAIGRTSSITGTSVTYAGGGGGGGTADTRYTGSSGQNGAAGGEGGGGGGGPFSGGTATAGTANTGGGGGGGAYNLGFGGNNQPGAAGGSGVVILAYPATFRPIASIGSGLTCTTNVVGTNIVYRFTAGTGNINW